MNHKILVTKSSMPPFEEYINEIREIWDSHWMTNMGPKHEALRNALKSYLSAKEIDLLTNGHMALELSMQALDLQGEVITTPFTFASTTHAIVRNGLTPVFCDIDPVNFTIDTTKIEQLITERTCAIVPVHVYGNICNVEEIQRIADDYGLKVIYDAAHAFGVRYRGKSVANYGDVSCYSFHATKVFNTIEGGAACFQNPELGQRLYRLKNFGIDGPESVTGVGANAKMNEFCAAMGLCNLRHVDDDISKRKQVAERYRKRLAQIPGLQLNPIQTGVQSNYAYFPVLFDPMVFGASRDDVFDVLFSNEIYARKYFYPLTNMLQCYQGQFDANQTPVARLVSERVLTLPLYSELPLDEVDRICDIVLRCGRK